MKKCTYPDCESEQYCRTYCSNHYRELRRMRDASVAPGKYVKQESSVCVKDACERKSVSQNLCGSHYNQKRTDAEKANGTFGEYGLDVTGSRVCRDCGKTKELADFPRRKGCLEGRAPLCKACLAATRAARRHVDIDATRAQEAAYRDSTRDQQRSYWRKYANRKRLENPGLYAARLRARYWADVERSREEARVWRAVNAEVFRESCRKAQSKRRALLMTGLALDFTRAEFDAKMAYWGNKCYMCGGPWKAMEHVKPISKGGAHALSNIRPACTSCNTSKGARWKGPQWAMDLIGSCSDSPWVSAA